MARSSSPALVPPPTRRPMLAVLVALLAIAFVAVIPQATAPAATASPSQGTPSSAPAGPVTVRWLVGIGGSGSASNNELAPETAFVAAFNGSQKQIYLDLEVVPTASLTDSLRAKIAQGDPPDIVGPVGALGRNGFAGEFMDVTPMVAAHNVDTRVWEPALLDLLTDETGAMVGLPYLMSPAFMFYNKDLFKAAGLPDLPRKVGETYMGKPWDWNTVAEIGQKLTLDKNGKHPTDQGFDANQIIQFGFDAQGWDARRLASAFGGGSFVGSDGKTAQIPSLWADGWKWYYDAMWTEHFAPPATYIKSSLLDSGATIHSGRIAMAATNIGTIDSYGSAGKSNIRTWDMAVMPSWKGQTSGPLDLSTFVIPNGSQHPDEAFQTILALMADPGLRAKYGGMPAPKADRNAWFAGMDRTLAPIFPNNQVSWSVLEEMAAYPAIPGQEADMPNATQAIKDYGAFYAKLQSQPGVDINAELAKLKDQLQTDFDKAGL
jgi:multiple sugar transport system substrate-binding protein